MTSVRRAYLYLVAAISLQSLTWAVIALLRNVALAGAVQVEAAALQLAVIIVAAPIYGAHWFVAERDARRRPLERQSAVRSAYLYGNLTLFLIPLLANTQTLLARAIAAVTGATHLAAPTLPAGVGVEEALAPVASAPGAVAPAALGGGLADPLVAMVVLGGLALAHAAMLRADQALAPPVGARAVLRRCFVYGGSGLGAFLTAAAAAHLIRLTIAAAYGDAHVVAGAVAYVGGATRLAVGLVAWLVCWGWAQRLFRYGSEDERRSTLRAVYLLLTRTAGAVLTAWAAASLITGGLRLAIGMPAGGDVSDTLPGLVVGLVAWTYHALVAREDAAALDEVLEAHRAYRYVLSGLGLTVALAGTAAMLQVVVRGLVVPGLGESLRSQFTWAAGALIVGLPLWLAPWRSCQRAARDPGSAGQAELRSFSRRAYLGFFLLAASVIVLTGGTYVVFRALAALMSEPPTPDETARAFEAFTYAAAGAAVWVAHALVLREDQRLIAAAQAERLERLRAVVVDTGDGAFGETLATALRQHLGLEASCFGAESGAEAVPGTDERDLAVAFREADVVVVAVPGGAGPDSALVDDALESASVGVLVPRPRAGWTWAGVEPLDDEEAVQRAEAAVADALGADAGFPTRHWGPAAVAAGVIGLALASLVVVLPLVQFVVRGGFLEILEP